MFLSLSLPIMSGDVHAGLHPLLLHGEWRGRWCTCDKTFRIHCRAPPSVIILVAVSNMQVHFPLEIRLRDTLSHLSEPLGGRWIEWNAWAILGLFGLRSILCSPCGDHGSQVPTSAELPLSLANGRCWWEPGRQEEGISHDISSSLCFPWHLCTRSCGTDPTFALDSCNPRPPLVPCPGDCGRFLHSLIFGRTRTRIKLVGEWD